MLNNFMTLKARIFQQARKNGVMFAISMRWKKQLKNDPVAFILEVSMRKMLLVVTDGLYKKLGKADIAKELNIYLQRVLKEAS